MPLVHSIIISFPFLINIWAQNKSVLERARMSQLFYLSFNNYLYCNKAHKHNAAEHIKSIF